MASRREQKEQARAARLEHERQVAARHRRRRNLIVVLSIAIAVVGSGVAISVSGGGAQTHSSQARATERRVQSLLAGIPQSRGNVLGQPAAPVTITEFSDLQCSACDAFDLPPGVTSPGGVTGIGILEALIKDEVRTGAAKLVYRSLETATVHGATPTIWETQQAAVNAAGLQGKGWNYVELFYGEQGAEGEPYVTMAFLKGLAKQIPGLDYARWWHSLTTDRSVREQVASDGILGARIDKGLVATPTIWVKGPRSEAVFEGVTASPAKEIATIEQAIKAAA